jgi:hypothetical protein
LRTAAASFGKKLLYGTICTNFDVPLQLKKESNDMRVPLMMALFVLGFSACKNWQLGKDKSVACSKVEVVDAEAFNSARSRPYRLLGVAQRDSCLYVSVAVQGKAVSDHRLIWTGRTTRSSPPQATFQLLVTDLEGAANTSKTHTDVLRYDLNNDQLPRPLLMYFLNDEKSFLLE